jgi:hypothetical protein
VLGSGNAVSPIGGRTPGGAPGPNRELTLA